MTHVHKFRSDHIDGETLDDLAAAGGYQSRADYLRGLVRHDAQRRGVNIGPYPTGSNNDDGGE